MATLGRTRKTTSRLRKFRERLHRITTWPRRSPTFGLFVGLITASLVFIGVLYVWSRTEVIRIGYELSLQQKIARALQEHNQRLRLELATRKDPAFVERQAREWLRMLPFQPASVRVVKAVEGTSP